MSRVKPVYVVNANDDSPPLAATEDTSSNNKKSKKIEDVLNDPFLFSVKENKFTGALNKALKVVNSRFVKKTTSFANEVLNITEKIKAGNPISKGAAAVASLEIIANFLNFPKSNPLKEYLDANNLKQKSNTFLVEMICSPKIMENLTFNQVFYDEESNVILHKIELGTGNFICLRKYTNKKDEDDDDQFMYYREYYHDESFDINKAYDFFWGCFNSKIYLVNKSYAQGSMIRLNSLAFDISNLLVNDDEANRVGVEITKCHEQGISRSYLLVGPPGTGKSSFCFIAAEKFCPRVLKIDPSVMSRMESGELEKFIEFLSPDAIIFDDIDRVDTEGYLLFVLENIKNMFPKLVIFATANSFEELGPAIVRPGRFDRVIWQDNPNSEYRENFFKYYLKIYNISIDDKLFEEVIHQTEGFSQAYMIEMIKRASLDADVKLSLMGSVKEFSRTLNMDREWSEIR